MPNASATQIESSLVETICRDPKRRAIRKKLLTSLGYEKSVNRLAKACSQESAQLAQALLALDARKYAAASELASAHVSSKKWGAAFAGVALESAAASDDPLRVKATLAAIRPQLSQQEFASLVHSATALARRLQRMPSEYQFLLVEREMSTRDYELDSRILHLATKLSQASLPDTMCSDKYLQEAPAKIQAECLGWLAEFGAADASFDLLATKLRLDPSPATWKVFRTASLRLANVGQSRIWLDTHDELQSSPGYWETYAHLLAHERQPTARAWQLEIENSPNRPDLQRAFIDAIVSEQPLSLAIDTIRQTLPLKLPIALHLLHRLDDAGASRQDDDGVKKLVDLTFSITDPRRTDLDRLLVAYLNKQGQYALAIAPAKRLSETEKDRFSATIAYGEQLALAGEIDAAVAVWTSLSKIAESQPTRVVSLADALMQQARLQPALPALAQGLSQNALRRWPNHIAVIRQHARIHHSLKMYQESFNSWYQLREVGFQQHVASAVAEAQERLLELVFEPRFRGRAGWKIQLVETLTKELHQARRARAVAAAQLLLRIYRREQAAGAVMQTLQDARKRFPDDPEIRIQWAQSLADAGSHDQALDELLLLEEQKLADPALISTLIVRELLTRDQSRALVQRIEQGATCDQVPVASLLLAQCKKTQDLDCIDSLSQWVAKLDCPDADLLVSLAGAYGTAEEEKSKSILSRLHERVAKDEVSSSGPEMVEKWLILVSSATVANNLSLLELFVQAPTHAQSATRSQLTMALIDYLSWYEAAALRDWYLEQTDAGRRRISEISKHAWSLNGPLSQLHAISARSLGASRRRHEASEELIFFANHLASEHAVLAHQRQLRLLYAVADAAGASELGNLSATQQSVIASLNSPSLSTLFALVDGPDQNATQTAPALERATVIGCWRRAIRNIASTSSEATEMSRSQPMSASAPASSQLCELADRIDQGMSTSTWRLLARSADPFQSIAAFAHLVRTGDEMTLETALVLYLTRTDAARDFVALWAGWPNEALPATDTSETKGELDTSDRGLLQIALRSLGESPKWSREDVIDTLKRLERPSPARESTIATRTKRRSALLHKHLGRM